jgi:hypothetical protein
MTRRAFAALPALLCRAAEPQLQSVAKIWDQAPHNAFTDLIRFRGRFYCAFREAQKHVSADGAIRLIVSKDMKRWTPASLVQYPNGDLRDPKLAITPKGELMLTTAVAFRDTPPVRHQSLVYTSKDARKWSQPVEIGDRDVWLWRVSWNARKEGLCVGYSTVADRFIRLYRTTDGLKYETLAARLLDDGNESSILFDADGTARCLLRRDEADREAMLGVSRPPYKDWSWRKLGARIGGPDMIRLPDGRLLAAVRLYDNKVRTSLCWVEEGAIREIQPLPSGGDTSYAGLAVHGGNLFVSYYSSHEGKTSIYLAAVRL